MTYLLKLAYPPIHRMSAPVNFTSSNTFNTISNMDMTTDVEAKLITRELSQQTNGF